MNMVFSCPSTGCVRNGWEFDTRVMRLTADKGYRAAYCGTVIYITPIWLAFCNSRLGRFEIGRAVGALHGVWPVVQWTRGIASDEVRGPST